MELVFDPFDLNHVEVRYMDTSFGYATPHQVGRHSHPMVITPREPGVETGIDYLKAIEIKRRKAIADSIGAIGYVGLDEEGN